MAIENFKETEENEIVKKSFQREVKVLRIVKTPNIVELKEAFKRQYDMGSPSTLEPLYIKRIFIQLLKAIYYCHQNDIVHRDRQPENLLINFGFARSLTASTQDLTDQIATRWYIHIQKNLGPLTQSQQETSKTSFKELLIKKNNNIIFQLKKQPKSLEQNFKIKLYYKNKTQ